jgi:UPF0716 protein FxsA
MGFIARFFLLVFILSVAELYILIKAAAALSLLLTLALCILTGVIGGALVRYQGLQTLRDIQRNMSRGAMPAEDIISGLILLIIGTMLLTPGFITDTIAFLMLIPALRKVVAQQLVGYFKNRIKFVQTRQGGFSAGFGGPGGFNPGQAHSSPHRDPRNVIIEVEPEDR